MWQLIDMTGENQEMNDIRMVRSEFGTFVCRFGGRTRSFSASYGSSV